MYTSPQQRKIVERKEADRKEDMDKIKNLVCFGAGEKSRHIRQLLQKYNGCQIKYYVEDQAFSKIGSEFDGLDVISIYRMQQLYKEAVIDGVVISTAYHKRTVQDMVETCVRLGLRDADIYLVKNNVLVSGAAGTEEILVPYRECVQIYDLNIHLADHCNMKCELCCHNSQLVEGQVFTEFETYSRDLLRMHELVPDIVRISLLGGEPLLHPNLMEFIEFTRNVYSCSHITVVTNGLLLKQSPPELLECLKRNNAEINVSLYPPMHHQLDDLLEYIRSTGIHASIHRVDRFFKKFCDKPKFDPKEMSEYCGYCMGLSDGRISRCIDSLYVHYFNQRFGKILPETEGYNIYDEDLDPLKLVHMLEQPMELCAYCGAKYTLVDTFEWKQITKYSKKEDILISD